MDKSVSAIVQLVRDALPVLQKRIQAGEGAAKVAEDAAAAAKAATDTVAVVEKEVEELSEKVIETVVAVGDLEDQTTTLLITIFSSLRFTTESLRITLVETPWKYIKEFAPRRYDPGEAVRITWNKWVALTGADPSDIPGASNRWLLHRDRASFDPDDARTKRIYTREELCLQGFWRWDETSNQVSQHGWYECIVRVFIGSQSPWQVPQYWAFRGTEDPPE